VTSDTASLLFVRFFLDLCFFFLIENALSFLLEGEFASFGKEVFLVKAGGFFVVIRCFNSLELIPTLLDGRRAIDYVFFECSFLTCFTFVTAVAIGSASLTRF